MNKFIVGKHYKGIDTRMSDMTVTRRSKKKIWAKNEKDEWTMKIEYDYDGNEYAVDNVHTPFQLKGLFCYLA